MAVTSNTYVVGGSGQAGPYSYAFPIIADADIRVSVNGVVKTVTTHYTLDSSNTRITFTSGNHPSTGDKVIVYRDTDEDPINSTFVSGSTIRSNELNDNFNQLLYIAQESDGQSLSKLGGVMEGNLGLGLKNNLYFEGDTDDAYETTLTVADPTADRTITLPNITGTVVTTGDTGSVATGMIAADAITNAKLADDSVQTEQIQDGHITHALMANNAIDTQNIADSAVTTDEIENVAVTTAKLADNAVTAVKIAANAVDTSEIATDAVTTNEIENTAVTRPKIANDAIDGTKIADNAVDTEHLATDAVTTDEIENTAVTTAKIAANAVTQAKMSANSVDSDQYVDGSIDSAHIGNDQIINQHIATGAVTSDSIGTGAVTGNGLQDTAVSVGKIADNAVQTAKINGLAVTTAKIDNNAVTTAKILDNAVTTAKIADAELTTLAGMQSATASILASSTALTATTAEINSVVDGKAPQTTISDDDTKYPTSGAVVDYVAAQIAPLGGLEVIADEDNFPTQPASGVVISISNCDGIVVNSSGVCTTARTAGNGSDNVTINNFPASLRSKTLTGELGLMVSSTGSSNTYNYHKLLAKEADVEQLSQDINDFGNRYRVGGSNPSSDNDDGDLFFNTGTGKMLVYNASNTAWEEVQSIGNFYINTIASYSGTGGNSATFNNSAYRFVLSNAPTNAQQLIVSVNGVVQKPNAGTSQPSEGFAIDGSSILFSAAPASGSDYFIITCGSTVNIGVPSDNTVDADIIQNGAVTRAKIADDAIDQSKLADNAVQNNHLIDNAVGTDEIADNAVTSAKIAANAVTGSELANNSVNSDNIYDDAINSQHYVNGSIDSVHLANDAVTQDKIADASVDEARLQISNSPTNGYALTAQSGNTGGLTWAEMSSGVTSDSEGNTVGGTNAGDAFSGTSATNNTLLGYDAGTGITTGDLNVAIGMASNVTGTTCGENTVVGAAAGRYLHTGYMNTGIGRSAMHSSVSGSTGELTGSYNAGVGGEALYALTTASYNTAIGCRALTALTTGGSNVAIGYQALKSVTTRGSQVAIGLQALQTCTTGYDNVAVGTNSLDALTTGYQNTALGLHSGQYITTGDYNTCLGRYAGRGITTGNRQVAIGPYALYGTVTGSDNVGIGYEALTANTSASNSVGIGYRALYAHTTGGNNVAVGYEAAKAVTTAGSNVALGYRSMYVATTADNNVSIGKDAGQDLTTGDNNTFIGGLAGADSTTGSGNCCIGVQAGQNQFTGASYQLYIARNAGAPGTAGVWIYANSGGACYNGNNSTAWSTTSDRRLKKNIVDSPKGLTEIDQLRVANFEYRKEEEIDMSEFPLADGPNQVCLNDETKEGVVQTGVIAQEIEAVLPECIKVSEKGAKTVNTDPILWALVNAVKELSAKVTALEAK